MRYAHLDGVNRDASVICLGTAEFGSTTPSALAFEIMDKYVENGGNFIDTARVYGDFAHYVRGLSEECIGRWMRARGNRDRLILATKGGCHEFPKTSPRRLDRASLTDDLHASLAALGTDHVDLYWLHRDDVYRPVAEILETLNGFLAQGQIRAFGASNWSAKRLREAERYAREHSLKGFVADQLHWSLAQQVRGIDYDCEKMDDGIYSYHAATRLACVPYMSQAKGFFNKLEQGGEENLSEWTRSWYLEDRNLRLYEALCGLREKYGASAGALQLSYLIAHPFPVFPIVYTSKLYQLDSVFEGANTAMEEKDAGILDQLVRELFGTI